MPKRSRSPQGPRGGYRQALAWAGQSESSGSRGGESKLAKRLIEDWCWGGIPASRIQQIALAAQQDGLQNSAIDKLAALGSAGLHPQNCHRDLMKALAKPTLSSASSLVPVQLKGKYRNQKSFDISALLPHSLFAA
eukprot:14997901-Alexandrium_andersonii.AAC.1